MKRRDFITLLGAPVGWPLATSVERRKIRPLSPATTALVVALGLAVTGARAAGDDGKYPAIHGAWARTGRGGNSAAWDTSKPGGLGQQAPLTPEYQAVFEANLADRVAGGLEYNPAINCLPAGMPRVMVA